MMWPLHIVIVLTRFFCSHWLFCNRSAYVLAAHLPKLDAIPSVHADFGPYLAFDLNYPAIWAITTELYYLILTPSVAVSHTPTTWCTHYGHTRDLIVPFRSVFVL